MSTQMHIFQNQSIQATVVLLATFPGMQIKMIMHYKSIEAPQAEQIHNTTKIGYKKTHLIVMSSKDI